MFILMLFIFDWVSVVFFKGIKEAVFKQAEARTTQEGYSKYTMLDDCFQYRPQASEVEIDALTPFLSNSGGTIIIASDYIWNALTSDMAAQCCRSWLSLKKDLDVQYLHPRIAIYSSMGLNPSTVLNVAATVGNKDVILGGEVGFDTAFASFTKYTAGINLNKALFVPNMSLVTKVVSSSFLPSTDYVVHISWHLTLQGVWENIILGERGVPHHEMMRCHADGKSGWVAHLNPEMGSSLRNHIIRLLILRHVAIVY
ncbi:mitochondrial outer membrane protein porin 4 [Tanacetum coccineum]